MPEYRAYAASVSDPDGNNVEAVVKEPDQSMPAAKRSGA
jgi:hypothetical protein